MEQSILDSLVGMPALVETGLVEATGFVSKGDAGGLVIACDEETWRDADVDRVVVSVFGSEALYRFSGRCELRKGEVEIPAGVSVERVQRRSWPRRRLDVAATLCPLDDTRRVAGIPGRTVDLGVGGLCVETLRPLHGDRDPVVILTLPDGHSIVARTTTVDVEDLGDGWRYRLAFGHLETRDANLILGLVAG
ncbi:MAG: PilZ domain-containing protein [Acidimicrobiales bacterium]